MIDAIENNPIWQQFQIADQIIRGVFSTQTPAGVIFTGPPGLGKSHLVRKIAADHGQKWAKSVLRPSASKLIMEVRDRAGRTLVFDDYDRVFTDERTIETFKTILDSHGVRILSNDVHDKRTKVAPFQVNVGAVFLSNKDFNDPKGFSDKVWKTQIPALKSRTFIIGLSFETQHILEYTRWIAGKVVSGVTVSNRHGFSERLSKEACLEVLRHFDEHWQRYPELSPRKIGEFAKLRIQHKDPGLWRAIVETQLQLLPAVERKAA